MKSCKRFILNFPTTHNFIYQSKKFPFNFDIFKYFSKKLFQEQEVYSDVTEINLLTDEEESQIDLSEDIINNFIKFCQQQECDINNDNVILLNFLSTKYEVDELTEITKDYISDHQKELRLNLISFKQKNFYNSDQLEQTISEHLSDYINDENFLKLPLPLIHRILMKNHDKQLREKDEYIEFLFRCLDTFGIGSSVLFEDIDFDKLPSKYQNLLLSEYSDKFDFHFINQSFLKSTYNMAGELVEKMKVLDEFNTVVQRIESANEQRKNEDEQKFAHFNDQINEIRNEMNEKKQEQKSNEDSIKKLMSDEIAKLKEEMRKMSQEQASIFDEKIRNEELKNEKLARDISVLRCEMARMSDVFNKVYPVGSIYMSVNSTSPQTLFGGVWTEWGQGRVPVGVSSSGTFSSVEKTGGSETHTLTKSEMPMHSGHCNDTSKPSFQAYEINFDKSIASRIFVPNESGPYFKNCDAIDIRAFCQGSGHSHNNLQPYITCYMWKRTG